MRRICVLLCVVCGALQARGADGVRTWEQTILQADQYTIRGEYAPALATLEAALKLAQSPNAADPRTELTLSRIGAVYCEQRKYREAESCFLRALNLLDRAPPNKVERSTVLEGLEMVHSQTGELSRAETFGRMALALREEVLGPNDPALAPPLQNLASVYHSEGRFKEAESLYLRALHALEHVGRKPDRVLASVHNNLARLSGDMGRPKAGIAHATIAVALWESLYGKTHPQVALGLNNLAILYSRSGRWTEAEQPIRRARDIVTDALGAQDPRLEPILRTYAAVMQHTGRKKEAKQMLEQAAAIGRQFRQDNLVGYTVDEATMRSSRERSSPRP